MADSVQSKIAPVRKPPLTQARLKKLLRYDPITGVWTWLAMRRGARQQPGSRAGTLKAHGYRTIDVDGRRYYEQQLAVLYMTGEMPDGSARIDHENRARDCGSWENVRVATPRLNCGNRRINKSSTTGFKGVVRHCNPKRAKRYGARIKINYRSVHLGWFLTPEEAHAAYCRAATQVFGEFACFG